MRRLTLAALILGALLLAACAGDDSPTAVAGLPARQVDTGDISVTITPTRLDDTAAEFAIAFDTHTTDLDLDVSSAATLEIDGTAWTSPTWTGDGPGGHHREGALRFEPTGSPAGTATLTLTGLDDPVVATWDLTEGG